jgi:hypothetical protein
MKYLKLDNTQRKDLMDSLAGMKVFLTETFGSLTADEARMAGPNGGFSPVEQVWHLADLEREGFGLRIERLQLEQNPHLPDFDGDRIALERNYRALSLAAGLKAFEEARAANLLRLQNMPAYAWDRAGTQDGVGAVSLCDMPVFIHQHDRAHVAEINAWKDAAARQP